MAPRTSRPPATGYRQALYDQLLLFPERAEYLEQRRFHGYRVRLDHWRELATEFRSAFEAVYERQSASVLLIYGPQGTGKTLFTRKLEEDFKRGGEPDRDNLWHVLAGGDPLDRALLGRATQTTVLRRIEARSGWLDAERRFAREDTHEMRLFLVDDVHKDAFLREWAELSQGDYLRLKADGKDAPVLESVAQKLVEDCRGDFKRAIFVLLSNDEALLDRLHVALDRSHRGLARKLVLPLPPPEIKEEIVRTNTNRLNQRTYWYCLDQGGPDEKRGAYQVLTGDGGFIDSFQAIDRALRAQAKRPGRPANKNLLTLVTLGSEPDQIAAFLADYELEADERELEPHLGVWLFRQSWASAFTPGAPPDYPRRASLVESEFSLRWVTLDMLATHHLCTAPADDDVAARITAVLRALPSVGDKAAAKAQARGDITEANRGLDALPSSASVANFDASFRAAAAQARARDYEPVIARRFGVDLSHGLRARPSVRPDLILGEYEPCEVTRATSDAPKAIEVAIRRSCHVIEITAHVTPDLRGLADYLRGKVDVYADLLESV